MIVVPALAHRDERQQPIVAGIVAGQIPLLSQHMGERVDAERPVIDEHGAQEESDEQARPSRDEKAGYRQHERRHQLVAVQPHQLGEAGEVGDLHEVGAVVAAREDPPEMAVHEALVARRVHVALGIGVKMVMPVLLRPPQHAFLRRALAHHGEHELERPAGRICPVREVAVVSGADGEDAGPIEDHADHDGLPGDARPDRPETGEMHQDEGNGRRIHDVFMGIVVHVRETLVGLGVGHGRSFREIGGRCLMALSAGGRKSGPHGCPASTAGRRPARLP